MTRSKRFITATRSIQGTRETQQDAAVLYERDGKLLAAVFDGMGGYSGGELASKTAASLLKELYKKKPAGQPCAEFFREAADAMDEAVFHLRDRDGSRLRAGTTVVAVIIEGDELTWLSVGDSRLYIIRGEEMIRATRDHNYFMQLDELRARGKLTESQYAAESARGESLVSYLGIGGLEILDVSETPFEIAPDDRLLLVSDGLYRALDEEKIQKVACEYGETGAVNILVSLAGKLSSGALDNTTCVLIRVC